MLRIKFSDQFPEWPLLRQTPGSSGVWGGSRFFVNEDIPECDFWVVYDGLSNAEAVMCPPANTVLITGEPPGVKEYRSEFLRQFGTVVTCHRSITHPHVIATQQGLPWHLGRRVRNEVNISFSRGYDDLKTSGAPEKNKMISMICSNKNMTEGHAKRLRFAEKIRESGLGVELFGRGIRDVEDKWDAIAPYKYHIVVENGSYPDYWTEKLADAFLGGAYPFYCGCPNLDEYFPRECYTPIDIDDFDSCVETIGDWIRKGGYEKSKEALARAKNLVLDEYNVFALANRICESAPSTSRSFARVELLPESFFSNKKPRGIKKLVGKIFRRR